jgi:hypothetical protein
MTMMRMTLTGISRGGMRLRAVSHIPLAVHLVVKVPALRPLSGVPFHAHQNPLVSPVHSRMPMDRYITRAPSSSRAAVVSTVLVRTAAAQASIVLDPSIPIIIVAAALPLTAAQNALPRKVAIASHRISALPLASDRPPPRPARMTDPVRRHSRQLQERSLLHDRHWTRPYASPRLPVPARGPSTLRNDPLRILGRGCRSRVDRLLPRRDRGESRRGALSTRVAP